MKKLLFGLGILLTANLSFAQELKFGLKAGVNFANQSYDISGVSLSPSSVTSLHFTGIVDLGITPMFSVQPGIGISGKGSKFKFAHYSTTINIFYLDIPVNGLVKFQAPKIGRFFVGAGPYADIKLSEKTKYKGEFDVEDTGDSYKSTDFGINILGGIELNKGYTFNLNYGLGLSNIAKASGASNPSAKNKVLSLSVGFLF